MKFIKNYKDNCCVIVGPTGPKGESDTIAVGEVYTDVYLTKPRILDRTGSPNHVLDFIFPVNSRGPTGPRGKSETIKIGVVKTIEANEKAKISERGKGPNHLLDFYIPKGKIGPVGPSGPTGATGPTGPTGMQGKQGKADVITIGTTKTIDSNQAAKVVDRTGSPNHILDFYIPKGEKGNKGNNAIISYAQFYVIDDLIIIPKTYTTMKYNTDIIDFNHNIKLESNHEYISLTKGIYYISYYFVIQGESPNEDYVDVHMIPLINNKEKTDYDAFTCVTNGQTKFQNAIVVSRSFLIPIHITSKLSFTSKTSFEKITNFESTLSIMKF